MERIIELEKSIGLHDVYGGGAEGDSVGLSAGVEVVTFLALQRTLL